MAEKCPFCRQDLDVVTSAASRYGVEATYMCRNTECPLSRLGREMKKRDLIDEANLELEKVKKKKWAKEATQTDVICPKCGRVRLEMMEGKYRCHRCGAEFKSDEKLEEALREAPGEERRRFEALPWWVKRGARKEEYKGKKKELREKYGRFSGKYREEKRKLKRRHFGISERLKTSEALKTNITTTNVITALVFTGAGFVLAAVMGNTYIMFAMLSVGLFTLIPTPPEYNGPPMEWGNMNPVTAGFWYSSHRGLALLRSLVKISAIVCFAMAFRDIGGVFNIPFMLVCFGGYFSLKIKYNSKIPGECIESFLRFAVLGAYFIPLVLFSSIFQSWVLVLIAFAFFAIPPISSDKEGSQLMVQNDIFLKMIFVVLMGAALIGSGSLAAIIPGDYGSGIFGQGWALEGAMAYTFMYFWFISLIGGIFTPSDSRPVIGFIMILGATVIWGLGPGSQEVGSALLGQWWPSVHNVFTEIANPLGEVFGALGDTFGSAFLMMTNPVAYAHQVMEGNYGQTGGTEKTGSFGVEISDFRIGTGMNDIFVEQPFQFMFTLKNEGGFEARNVSALVYTDLTYNIMKDVDIPKIPEEAEMSIKTGTKKVQIGEIFGLSKAGLEALEMNKDGKTRVDCNDVAGKCSQYIFYADEQDSENENNLEQQDMRSFILGGTLGCEVVERAGLREKFIPVIVDVRYEYSVESSFKIEFLGEDEWSRRAKAGNLEKRTEVSEVTSAPVKLSIGSMEQPIKAGTGFFIGLELKSMEGENSRIIPPVTVEVDIPEEFGTSTCYGQASIRNGKIIWRIETISKDDGGFQDRVLYCDFYPEPSKIVPGETPSKTYFITANATYRFSKQERKDAKVAFGSWCCGNDDCEKLEKVCVKKSGEDWGTCQ